MKEKSTVFKKQAIKPFNPSNRVEDILKYQRYLAHRLPHSLELSKQYAEKLVILSTPAEGYLKSLFNESGIRFYFQYNILFPDRKFVLADFYLPDYHLIVELDGKHHLEDEMVVKDNLRSDKLSSIGFSRVLRFLNSEAFNLKKESLKISLQPYYLQKDDNFELQLKLQE